MESRNASTRDAGSRTRLALLCVMGSFFTPMPALATTSVTQITYDAGDHVASVTDPRGLVTTYTYDGLGQLWQQVSPDTGTTTYNYDIYGRRIGMTRADNSQTSYGYDDLDRPTSISAGGQSQSFTYDTCTHGIGRLCSAADATGTTSYSYSPEGWLTGRGFAISGTTYSLGYSYNAVGQLASVVYPDGNQAIYNYTRGVVSGITLDVGDTSVTGASAITYRPMNAGMSSWTSSNGVVNTLSYDTDGRLTGINAGSVQSLGFSYDLADRIVGITNGIDNSVSQNFGYDDESRLVSVYSGADIESYQYDLNGNRISQVVNGASTPEMVSTISNQLTSFGAQSYGYDTKGNTTTVAGVATYHYDAFNRMDSAGGMAYYVNPEGQRLRKSGAAGTSYFAPDRNGAMLAEYSNGSWIDYVWLNGRLIGRVAGGQRYAIHDDQTGRPEAVTDGSQNIVWRAQNFAFTQNVTNAGITLNLGFPGQYYDVETSAWNNGFRDYNSGLGRYVESDPIGLGGGANTYAYVGGNPTTNFDPLGLGTLAVGGQVSGAFTTLGGSLSFQLTISWNSGAILDPSQWRVGEMFNAANIASTGVGVFGGALFTYATANCPEALSGSSPYSGASGGDALVGGGDISYGDINTYNLSIGAGGKAPLPFEAHTGVVWTVAQSLTLPQFGHFLAPDGGI